MEETPFSNLLILARTMLFKNQIDHYRLEIWQNAKNGRARGTLQSAQFYYKAEDRNQEFPVIEEWRSTPFQMKEYSSETELLEAVKLFLDPNRDRDAINTFVKSKTGD